MTDPEKLLDVDAVAEILGVDERTVYEMLRRGELPGVDVGRGTKRRSWRVRPSDLDRWQQARRVNP